MSGFILNELLDKLSDRSHPRFGSTLPLRVATADAKSRTVTYEYEVTDDEIIHGHLSSGWLSTIIDHATEPLIYLTINNKSNNDNGHFLSAVSSYASTLAVHILEPVAPGTRIEIVCRLVLADARMLQTTVTFRDPGRKSLVYATGVQSLISKEPSSFVGGSLPSGGAKL
ncbi:hypothetical protein GGI11_004081 [Coemansia sp. RSA 2049]|nr:hypothetical protein GGI11_004081 [Coemansia sp. RSA 2049]KAJ2522897.1 hypothetical protein H4217_000436 [Coemansia sp. RSA 1939]KAJ2618196.1 hypothetical protein EV177_000153 [Coemansia sp. RSA 1804]KAJ2695323.1 hypothetical protein GGH99_000181 [Coemansia sp. RSA 1285]